MIDDTFKQLIEAPANSKKDFLEKICTRGIIQRTMRLTLQYPDFSQKYLDSQPKAVMDDLIQTVSSDETIIDKI